MYNFINFTDKNETINLYAGWKVNTYYLAFNGGEGGIGSIDTITLKYTDFGKVEKITSPLE